MDYDATTIPPVYDRGRSHRPEVLDLWMNTIASYLEDCSIKTVLDLGCGTGRFSDALATHLKATVIGIDPSTKMMREAHAKPSRGRIRYARASGEAIPLTSGSVDLVFMSMVFHHFDDPWKVARECGRVLRPGGRIFVRAATVEQIPAYPYVPFIPASRPLLEERLPKKELVMQVFEAAGLQTMSVGVVVQEIAATYAAYVEKLAAGGDSILASLTASDLENGFDAIRAHSGKVDPKPVSEPIDVFVFG